MRSKESKEREYEEPPENTPDLLDVVRIDGRWAQITSSRTAKYLDNGKGVLVDFNDYDSMEYEGYPHVADRRDEFTKEEYQNLSLAPEAPKDSLLKGLIRVWGEFNKKKKKYE